MNQTPKGNRIHIGIFGRRNAGKSSLINALTGQDLAIVSDTPGTTTDPISKAMELHPIGPVEFIDTAGFDDEGELGRKRTGKTKNAIDSTDIAIVVIDGDRLPKEALEHEKEWIHALEERSCPVIVVMNKWDLIENRGPFADGGDRQSTIETAEKTVGLKVIPVSTTSGKGMDDLRDAIAEAAGRLTEEVELLPDWLGERSLVLLVMPQDIQAPKGRLILPQVQTIRALLDRKCTVVSTTADGLTLTLNELRRAPDLIITDSQCFGQVSAEKPEETPLTSFSILMAKVKGDIEVFIDGTKAIDDLAEVAVNHRPRILIAEACTHVPQSEDIGTVKIPRMLRERFGDEVEITNARGNDFPDVDELRSFDMIIHCGACMFNRRHVMSRIVAAQEAGVPITNYGVFLAKMNGMLENIRI